MKKCKKIIKKREIYLFSIFLSKKNLKLTSNVLSKLQSKLFQCMFIFDLYLKKFKIEFKKNQHCLAIKRVFFQ